MFVVTEGSLPRQKRKGIMLIIPTTSQSATAAPLTRLITRHPLVVFFVLAYLGAWISWLPLVLAKTGLGVFPLALSAVLIYLLEVLGSLVGPTLAAFLVTAATSGKAGVRHLLRSYLQRPQGLRWFLIILVGAPLLVVVAGGIASRFETTHALNLLTQRWSMLVSGYLPQVFIHIPGGPLGEEPGWRGVALPRLQQRYGAFLATLILGGLWGLWHFPLFLVTGLFGPFSLPNFGVFLLGTIVLAFLLTWTFNSTAGSLLMVIVLHAALDTNSSLVVLLSPVFPWLGWTLYVVYGACALLLIVGTRGHLSYHPERIPQAGEAQMTPAVAS